MGQFLNYVFPFALHLIFSIFIEKVDNAEDHQMPAVFTTGNNFSQNVFNIMSFNDGENAYETLITQQEVFIDKSRFINAFFHRRSARTNYFFTAPRKFGKTTMAHMLKTFAELNLDKDTYKPVKDITRNKNYQIFHAHNRNISVTHDTIMFNVNFGQFPVIFLNFATKARTYESLRQSIYDEIRKVFIAHAWLLNRTEISINQRRNNMLKESYKRIMSDNATENDITYSIQLLGNVLGNYFQKKVILIIDNIDGPFLNALAYRAQSSRIQQLLALLIKHGVKENEDTCIDYSFFTGIVNIFYHVFAGHNDLVTEVGFLETHPFRKFFGFTETEMDLLFEQFSVSSNERRKIEQHYGGYLVLERMQKLYNSYSIARYFQHRVHPRNNESVQFVPASYWLKAEEDLKFIDMLKNINFRTGLCCFHRNLSINFSFKRNLTVGDFQILESFLAPKNNRTRRDEENIRKHENIFLSFLFHMGYLTYDKRSRFFRIPNAEVWLELDTYVREYYETNFRRSRKFAKKAGDFIWQHCAPFISEKIFDIFGLV